MGVRDHVGLAVSLFVLATTAAACGDNLAAPDEHEADAGLIDGGLVDAMPDAGPAPAVVIRQVGGAPTEAGGTATFAVRLTAAPTADVVVPIVVDAPDEAAPSVAQLTFSPANALVERPVPRQRGPADVVIAVDPAIAATRTGAVQAGRLAASLVRELTSTDRYALVSGATSLAWQAGGAALDARALAALGRPASVTLDVLLVAAAERCAARDDGATSRCTIILISDALTANDAEVRAAVSPTTPVLTVAVGPAPNHGLLAAIAARSGGATRAVLAADDPRDLVPALLADAAGSRAVPSLAFTGVEIEAQEPRILPSLGAGQAVLVLARARGGRIARKTKLKVDGNLFGLLAPRPGTTVDEPMTSQGLLARRWAAATLARLEAEAAPARDIETLALAHGLVSSRTALVAVGADVVVEGGVQHSVAVAVAPPVGMGRAADGDALDDLTPAPTTLATTMPAPPPPPPPGGGGDAPRDGAGGLKSADDAERDRGGQPPVKSDVVAIGGAVSSGEAADLDEEDRRRLEAPAAEVALSGSSAGGGPRLVSYFSLAAGAAVGADGGRPALELGLRLTSRRGITRLGLGATGSLVFAGVDETGAELPRELALRPTMDVAVRRSGGLVELGASIGVHIAAHPGLAYALALRGPRWPLGRSGAWLVPVLRWDGTIRPAAVGLDYPGLLTFGFELAR